MLLLRPSLIVGLSMVASVSCGLSVSSSGAAQITMTDATPLTPLRFEVLAGWADDDHAAALAAFRLGCATGTPPKNNPIEPRVWAELCRKADAVPDGARNAARKFFEAEFIPLRIESPGFVTGYYEPEVAGSLTRTTRFAVPLFKAPDDLEKLTPNNRPKGLDGSLHFGRRTKGGLVEHPDRAAIDKGALDGRDLELVWLESPVDAFFIHIQGSARIRLQDGSLMRIAYAAKSGQAYTPIGRILIERGDIAAADMSMDALRDWLRNNPEDAPALMRANRSYIFFQALEIANPQSGPIGAAGVSLMPLRSIAIDDALLAYGTPIFVSAHLPLAADGRNQPYHQLMIAQDTGSAIKGPARGDLFIGSGDAAGTIAGRIRHRADFVQLVPRGSSLGREASGERK